jgi:hypothetical protein
MHAGLQLCVLSGGADCLAESFWKATVYTSLVALAVAVSINERCCRPAFPECKGSADAANMRPCHWQYRYCLRPYYAAHGRKNPRVLMCGWSWRERMQAHHSCCMGRAAGVVAKPAA